MFSLCAGEGTTQAPGTIPPVERAACYILRRVLPHLDPDDAAPPRAPDSRSAPPNRPEGPTEPAAVPWVVLTLGLVLGVAFEGLVRWFGVAAVLATLPVVREVKPLAAAWTRLRPHVPVLVPIVLSLLLLAPLLGGDPPASRDHGIHYYQVHLLLDRLLPAGRTHGWIEGFNNGYPFGESYPVLGYLWMGALHLLSLGVIDLRTSYALGIAAMWALSVWAVARLGSALAREAFDGSAPAIAWTAALAGVLWLLDPGGSREGGWAYTMFHGVWPQLLSTSLWVLSLTLQWDALRHPSPRKMAVAAIALGGSVLAHPFGLLTAAASGGIGLGVLAFTDAAQKLPAGRFRWWAMMHVLAIAIASGWIATFLAASESMARAPVIWRPLGDLAAALLRGDLFAGPWAFAGPAAVVGMLVLVRRGAAHGWLVLGLLAAMLVLASPASITVLRLDLVLSSFKNLQFPRWSIAIKPLLFTVSALGLVFVARAAAGRLPARPAAFGLGPRFVAALLAAPLLAALVPELGRLAARPVAGIDTLASAELEADDLALREALEQARASGDGRLRVAFLRSHMSGATWPLFALADADADIVLDGHVPSINFKHRIGRPRASLLGELGVTHVLWDGSIERDTELTKQLENIGHFGRFTLARLHTDTPPPPAAELVGEGELSIVSTSPHEIVVDLASTNADSELLFFAAPHVKWKADREGAELLLDEWGSGRVQMRIVAPGDGRVTLRYVDTPIEQRARWLGLGAGLLALGALAFKRPLQAATRLHAASARRVSWLLGVATFALALAFVARRQQRLLRETWDATVENEDGAADGPPPVFVRDLVDAEDVRVETTPARACIALHEKNALPGCSEAEHAPAISFSYREPYLYRCLELSIPPLGEARVYFDGVGAGELVLGTLQRVSHEGSGRDIDFAFSARPRPLGNRPRYLRLDGERVGSGHPLVLTSDRRTPERVCISAAVFAP